MSEHAGAHIVEIVYPGRESAFPRQSTPPMYTTIVAPQTQVQVPVYQFSQEKESHNSKDNQEKDHRQLGPRKVEGPETPSTMTGAPWVVNSIDSCNQTNETGTHSSEA